MKQKRLLRKNRSCFVQEPCLEQDHKATDIQPYTELRPFFFFFLFSQIFSLCHTGAQNTGHFFLRN